MLVGTELWSCSCMHVHAGARWVRGLCWQLEREGRRDLWVSTHTSYIAEREAGLSLTSLFRLTFRGVSNTAVAVLARQYPVLRICQLGVLPRRLEMCQTTLRLLVELRVCKIP